MTTTPEQLQAWREEFEAVCLGALEIVKLSNGTYADRRTEAVWQWHISSKQETEQVMKLAKFGAMVMDSKILMYHDSETITDAIACELLVDDAHHGDTVYGISYAPNIEATIKELLK